MTTQEVISSIIQMGFEEELARKAYKNNGNNKEKTIHFLTKLKKHGDFFDETVVTDENDSDYVEETTEDDDDPLAFIKSPSKIKALKDIIYQEVPEDINSAIKTEILGLSMTDCEEIVHNQEAFLDLLCDNKDTKEITNMKSEKVITAKSKKDLEKVKSGFSNNLDNKFLESMIEQAFYACEKNIDATIKLLNEK